MSKLEFLKQFDQIAATFPVQGKARAIIHNGLDFPSTRDEYWKYTKVAPLINAEYKQNSAAIELLPDFTASYDSITIAFVNGVYAPELSDALLPDGLSVSPMTAVEGDRKNLMLDHLGSYVDHEHQAFNALNTSYFKDGAFISVSKGIDVAKPIRILNISSGELQATNPRNLILLEEQASASFILQFEGHQNQGAFTNALSEVVVKSGAQGALHIVQNEGSSSAHINAAQIIQEKDSSFSVVTVTKSGSLVRNNLNFEVRGQGCESNMYGIYFGSERQHIDNHTFVDHLVANCQSNELYKGVMADKATGVFNGKIMVRKDAQQINAFQSNQNILLSDQATINTKPELEIYADDVKCSHGCTIGQLDDEAMFYLQSRGLGRLDAQKLLVHAFAAEVLEHIRIDGLRSEIESFVEQKFARLDA